ncbi:WD-40 repeat protein [Reticulomyxa filosa]|uniref:WD-40 repeat protein n=1 Tax=Reticulomyxa filosa TaxID=46433 RepID=X6MCC9_RETFI|nr:WD-40 repeat protein [Reticulomyxa filosa]|eukprot:ETO10695.1 WD-40 repeat protein [Reticulomyxa filosa]
MTTFGNKKQALIDEEEIQLIIQYWIRILDIKLGWIQDFDKFVVKYVMLFFFFYLVQSKYVKCLFVVCYHCLKQAAFTLDIFCSSSKLLKTFTVHASRVNCIDTSTFDDGLYLSSGSDDNKVCVWDVDTGKKIQSFDGHLGPVYCVKFTRYHNHHRNTICSSSSDNTIRFWNIKDGKQLQEFNGHTEWVGGIEFSSFNGGRYLCSGSNDKTIRLWDIETSKSLHIFNGHTDTVWCVDFSPLQGNNNNDDNKSNIIGVIGGNGYTICSGSFDNTIRIWDIETSKNLIKIKGHKDWISGVKYGSNELRNTILSGSLDKSVCLWDIRSGQQIQVFNGHTSSVVTVEYSPFVINNIEASSSYNVICSGSTDNTIKFWDIRSNKSQLHIMKGNNEDDGIQCIKFLQVKRKKGKQKQ